MKKKLAFGFGVLVPLIILAASAPVIQWYSQQPTASVIQTNDIFSLERKSPHEYMSISALGLAAALGGTNSGGTTLPNGSGVLTNNGSGAFGYLPYNPPFGLPSGSGVLTNDGSGILGWLPYSPPFSLPSGTGVLTNDGSGNLGWVLPIDIEFGGAGVATNLSGSILHVTIPGNASDILSLSNNLTTTINSASNSILTQSGTMVNTFSNNITTTINSDINTASNNIIAQVATNRYVPATNIVAAPDFSKDYGWTNVTSGFTVPLPINLPAGGTNAPTFVWYVQGNGTPLQVTAGANEHVVPNSVMWVTNLTAFTFHLYGNQFTNVYGVPIY